MKLDKNFLIALCEAQKDDTSAIKSFIEKTKKIFHNKADVYLEGEYSDDPKVLIHLDKDCYQYWNDFVKNCLPTFTFDDIFADYGEDFKYEDDGYLPRDGSKSFSIVIYLDELFDIEVDFLRDTKNFTMSKMIDTYIDRDSDTIDSVNDLSSSFGPQISKLFGGISETEVEKLLYHMIENT